jgi:hypothetical protein
MLSGYTISRETFYMGRTGGREGGRREGRRREGGKEEGGREGRKGFAPPWTPGSRRRLLD